MAATGQRRRVEGERGGPRPPAETAVPRYARCPDGVRLRLGGAPPGSGYHSNLTGGAVKAGGRPAGGGERGTRSGGGVPPPQGVAQPGGGLVVLVGHRLGQ